MSLWQPRSLQQLILVSIFAALAPLGLAILFTIDTLGELSEKNRQVTQTVVDATRLDQEIQRDVLELERRARQYMALADLELANLFVKEQKILSETLMELQEAVPTPSPDITGLLGSLARLSLPSPEGAEASASNPADNSHLQRLDHEFSVISEQSNAVKTWLLSSVDQLLEANEQEVESLRDNLSLQLSALAAGTFTLLLFLAYWINRPVKELSREIHLLATSGLSHPIEISGPLELQALGRELEWLRQSLLESEQQKEQFLRHISHELKTPLASLREGADLLADQVPGHLSRQQSEIVEIVRLNGIELQRLIENLIDYNRLPTQGLSVEEFAIEPLWREILASYSLSVDKKALRLSLTGSIVVWRADREKTRTCLDNLFSNAVNYTPDKGRIDITWRAENATLIVEVANSGDPIPSKDAERVFEPFFQSAAKRTGPIKGSGIGLSVARECIEAQGGELSLTRHSSLPVCFRLTCPVH